MSADPTPDALLDEARELAQWCDCNFRGIQSEHPVFRLASVLSRLVARIEAAERLIAALHVAGADGRAAWDADQDVRAGKLLAAIEGTRGIRVELDNIRAAWLLSRLPQQEKAR